MLDPHAVSLDTLKLYLYDLLRTSPELFFLQQDPKPWIEGTRQILIATYH